MRDGEKHKNNEGTTFNSGDMEWDTVSSFLNSSASQFPNGVNND